MLCALSVFEKHSREDMILWVQREKRVYGWKKGIINIAMNSSSTEAARMVNRSTVKISSGTIRNLLEEMETPQSGESQ